MFNELIVVAVTPFSGTDTPDKNGRMSVMLQCLAGTMPNRNVLSGTVAERAGFEVGKTYVAQVREDGYDVQFGTSFTFVKVQELTTGADTVESILKLGAPQIIIIDKPEGFESTYHRKTDAIVGQRTKRQIEGKFEPAINASNKEHITADKVFEGSSAVEDKKREESGQQENVDNKSPQNN